MWLIESGDMFGACGFFVDTQATYCVDQDGNELGVLRKAELSPHQGDKWHMVTYLSGWQNVVSLF